MNKYKVKNTVTGEETICEKMEAKDFLEKNGFKQDSNGNFINGICAIRISDSNYGIGTYENDFGEEGFVYSPDLNIYWLIGVLTYYGLIDKNYIQQPFDINK